MCSMAHIVYAGSIASLQGRQEEQSVVEWALPYVEIHVAALPSKPLTTRVQQTPRRRRRQRPSLAYFLFYILVNLWLAHHVCYAHKIRV